MVQEGPTWKGALAAAVVGVALLLGVAEVGARLLYPQWREFYSGWFEELTAVPGYDNVPLGHPGFDGYFSQNNGDFRAHIQINEFGLRNDEPVAAADGRVWVIGDSMAFGWGVERTERYTEVMGVKASVPVYNIASPGTAICGYQSLLARMPKEVKPRAVVMGLILENDLRAHYDCPEAARLATMIAPVEEMNWSFLGIKHHLTKVSALYNVVAVALKRVPVVTQALRALHLVAADHVYTVEFDPARMETVVSASVAEIARFKAMLPPGIPFAVLMAPGRFEIRDNDPLYRTLRLDTGRALAAQGIDVVDPIAAFQAAGFAPTHFAHDGHWSPLGHRIAGEALANWLKKALP